MIEIWDGQTDLRPLAEAWAKEIGIDADIDCAMEDLRIMYESPDSDVLLLYTNERLVGAIGITIQNISHTRELHSAERYIYVLPEYRAFAKSLIEAAKEWSRQRGCVKMMIGESTLSAPCGKFYEALGFRVYETIYIGDL